MVSGGLFVAENWFLIILAVVWMIVAIIQDFRKREVANWWNFSLIAIALAYRGFLSVSRLNHWYFSWGIIGLAVGFIIANIFYYARMFAGGDAKLMMGLGVILPLSLSWMTNFRLLIWFLVLFLLLGGLYGGIYSIVLALIFRKEFIKEFVKKFKVYMKIVISILILSSIGVILGVVYDYWLGIWLGGLIFISPLLLVYAKAIEEACMVKGINVKYLTIGDWLAKSISVGRKKIEPNWQGLDEDELKLIQLSYKKDVLIKYGIPFTPSFLLAFVALLGMFKYLGNFVGLLW